MYLEKKKKPHYPILNLVFNVLFCIFDVKKGCKKKSLNKFSLAADLLKACRGNGRRNTDHSKVQYLPGLVQLVNVKPSDHMYTNLYFSVFHLPWH